MRVRAFIFPIVLGLAACGGNSDDPSEPACSGGPYLSVCPVAIADINSVVPLGNLNPPGHTFPTDHMYLYLRVPSGEMEPVVTTLFSPGDLTVRSASATEHVTAGFTDYSLTLAPCGDVEIVFGHVSSLDEFVFGDVSSLEGWTSEGEYSTGGETYRRWTREWDLPVTAGTILGTTGGRAGQWALDVGAYDLQHTVTPVANPARWEDSRYLQAICPLDLYERGAVLNEMLALLERTPVPGDAHPCGWILQDVPGTAQGCWFAPGAPTTYPEDPHLALVWSNTEPERAVLSVGTSVIGLSPGRYRFDPLGTGRLNRPFDAVTPDGLIYGYQPLSGPGILLIEMQDAMTIRIEKSASATPDPATWSFTGNSVVFER